MTYTVEFNGNKGWEIGCETEIQEQAILYMVHCLAGGYEVRLTVESDDPDYVSGLESTATEATAFSIHLQQASERLAELLK